MWWRPTASPLFRPDALHAVARSAVGLPHARMVRHIIDELARLYPGHIETHPSWMLSLAGGVTGIVTVLHGSLSELVLIFGTPVGSEGFSGRHLIEFHDFMLAGQMWTYTEHDFVEPRAYRPGDVAVLRRREVKGVRLGEGAWMLEYGRGVIPSGLLFGLGDALAAFEFPTIARTIWTYGRLTLRELRQGKI
ncbi:MAG TPA: isomerase [Methylomirabilota bacterium]|nr:isomerase [Methylomirabilota bacterium]